MVDEYLDLCQDHTAAPESMQAHLSYIYHQALPHFPKMLQRLKTGLRLPVVAS